jgi:RNA polymerase sigma-70 factor (ECF subfamily)
MMAKETRLEAGAGDDLALVHSAKQGSKEAFESLVRRHIDMILRVVKRIADSREDAEDIAQEALLKAFQNLHNFEERARFSTWLTRIAINEALMKVRRPRRAPMISIDDEKGEFRLLEHKVADRRPDPEELFSRTQLSETLQRELDALPHAYRVVVLMRDIQGFSTSDTAEVLELSVPSVKSRLLRARLKLRKRLGAYSEWSRTAKACAAADGQILNQSRAA